MKTSTEIKIYHGGKEVVSIFDGEDKDVFTTGNLAVGFENCESRLMLTTKIAKSSEALGGYEITYEMNRNEAYVLLASIEAYLKIQPKSSKIIEE